MKSQYFPVLVLALILTLWPFSPTAAAVRPIEDSEISIPTDIPFGEQLQRHAQLLARLSDVIAEIDRHKEEAKRLDSLTKYMEAEGEYKNVQNVLVPYGIARAKALSLIEQGYLLGAIEPKVCKAKGGDCVAIDAITAVFFFDRQQGLSPDLSEKTKAARSDDPKKQHITVNGFDLTAFVEFLGGKPLDMATFGILPAIRDAIIPLGKVCTNEC